MDYNCKYDGLNDNIFRKTFTSGGVFNGIAVDKITSLDDFCTKARYALDKSDSSIYWLVNQSTKNGVKNKYVKLNLECYPAYFFNCFKNNVYKVFENSHELVKCISEYDFVCDKRDKKLYKLIDCKGFKLAKKCKDH